MECEYKNESACCMPHAVELTLYRFWRWPAPLSRPQIAMSRFRLAVIPYPSSPSRYWWPCPSHRKNHRNIRLDDTTRPRTRTTCGSFRMSCLA